MRNFVLFESWGVNVNRVLHKQKMENPWKNAENKQNFWQKFSVCVLRKTLNRGEWGSCRFSLIWYLNLWRFLEQVMKRYKRKLAIFSQVKLKPKKKFKSRRLCTNNRDAYEPTLLSWRRRTSCADRSVVAALTLAETKPRGNNVVIFVLKKKSLYVYREYVGWLAFFFFFLSFTCICVLCKVIQFRFCFLINNET